ncbi:Hypothetical predicted protein [Pelobates cultripes]|uniref:Uncharacterized protein n=1 Tax=Pelobates cultripes TaxID=61616 RepID=A0AAD1S328_PELCU|nr:Hypothetical predicted protein [Pelobates cultripes]
MRAHTAIPLKTRYGAGVTRPRPGAYSSLSRGETAAPPGLRTTAGCPPPLDRRGLSRSPRVTTTDDCRAQTRARPQNTAQRERSKWRIVRNHMGIQRVTCHIMRSPQRQSRLVDLTCP